MGFFSDEEQEWKEQVKCFRKVIYPRGISEVVRQEAEDKVYSTVKRWKIGFDIFYFFLAVNIINNGFTSDDVKLMIIAWIGTKIVEAWGKSKVIRVAKELQHEKDKHSELMQYKICSNCGKEVQPNWNVCPACGTKVQNTLDNIVGNGGNNYGIL